jgi:hypothetical protein
MDISLYAIVRNELVAKTYKMSPIISIFPLVNDIYLQFFTSILQITTQPEIHLYKLV